MTLRLTGLPDQPSRTGDLRNVLIDDLVDCWAQLKKEDTQVARRNYIRAAFAFVEGFTAVMKSGVLAEFNEGRAQLSVGELAQLLEESYSTADDGSVQVRGSYVPFASNIRLAFDLFARMHDVTERPNYSDSGWRDLREAHRVRNRITHPKVTQDLTISDAEVVLVGRAWQWYLASSFVMYQEGRLQLKARIAAMADEQGG